MSRIAIIGNAGGGKSTLARVLARRRQLRHVEIDQLLWQEGWKLSPADVYLKQHADLIAGDRWVIDGLGQQASIPDRLSRATEIILVDMPLWMHFWLAAERQIAWVNGKLEHTPGGISTIPPMQALFRTMWEVEQTWMPEVRALCAIRLRWGRRRSFPLRLRPQIYTFERYSEYVSTTINSFHGTF